jgi:hypothetical protein
MAAKQSSRFKRKKRSGGDSVPTAWPEVPLEMRNGTGERGTGDMVASRFDLEEAIAACWSTQDDLKLVFESSLDGDASKEDLANALLGLASIHGMRVERAFRIFEELVRSGKIS